MTQTWKTPPVGETWYSLTIELMPEDDGGYSAICLNCPGAGSQGETIQEALENATEACTGWIESYIADRRRIPWSAVPLQPIPQAKGSLFRRIVVKIRHGEVTPNLTEAAP